MPLLLEAARSRADDDYVSAEHVAAAFGMVARRMATLPPSAVVAKQEREALDQAARFFEQAAQARMRRLAARPAGRSSGSGADYPQRAFEQPRALVLRARGDALAWLGREREARAVFGSAAARSLWPDPLCRPAVNWATRTPLLGRGGAARARPPYVLDAPGYARAFAHVIAPLWKWVRGALRRDLARAAASGTLGGGAGAGAGAGAAGRWVAESAGLHKRGAAGGGWSTIVLWANGRPGAACRGGGGSSSGSGGSVFAESCEQLRRQVLRSAPALHLRDGQIKLSRMDAGTRVRPHCGPSNARLRIHCSVAVQALSPAAGGDGDGSDGGDGGAGASGKATAMRVGSAWRSWGQDGCFVFREDCEHEVRVSPALPAGQPRVVLIADFANPFLASAELYQAALLDHAAGSAAAAEEYRAFRAREERELRRQQQQQQQQQRRRQAPRRRKGSKLSDKGSSERSDEL